MRGREKEAARRLRRIGAMGLAGCLLFGGYAQVKAATLKDVFDEHYYADTYADLKEAYGYDREALWEHFVTFGLAEGRTMNGLIDIVKYRDTYADLDEAFGDNWDAYLEHYLTYGAKEGRESGTGFNAVDYAERYEDLQEAFGEDVLALWQHYQTYGVSESREARDENIVLAEKAAEEAKRQQEIQQRPQAPSEQEPQEPSEEPSEKEPQEPSEEQPEQPSESGTYTERVDHSDDDGWDINEYDSEGRLIKETTYDGIGKAQRWSVWEYSNNGKTHTLQYYHESSFITEVYESNNADQLIKWTHYKDGIVQEWIEVERNGEGVKDAHYDGDGRLLCVQEYDSTGRVIRRTYYNADGSVDNVWILPET